MSNPEQASFLIREAVEEDAKALLDLFVSVVEEEAFFIMSTEECLRTVEEQAFYIRYQIQHSSSCIFVMMDGEELIGKISVLGGSYLRTQHVGTIEMFVRARYRGKGIGSALLKYVIEWSRANRFLKKLSLSVFADNKAAIALYQKHGFVEEGRSIAAFQEVDNRLRDNIYMAVFV